MISKLQVVLINCIVLLLCKDFVLAQSSDSLVHIQSITSIPQYSFGFLVSYGQNKHNTSLPCFAGQDCGSFSDGISPTWNVTFTYDKWLLNKVLEISGRITYSSKPAELQRIATDNLEVYDPATNSIVPLVRKHVFSADLKYISLHAGVNLYPLPLFDIENIPLFLHVGMEAGNPLIAASYTQTQTILSPNSRVFSGGQKTVTVAEGQLSDAGTLFSAYSALGYDLALTKEVSLRPEAGLQIGLNSLLANQKWNFWGYLFQIGARWQFYQTDTIFSRSKKQTIDTLSEKIVAPVAIRSLSTRPLEVMETVVTQTFPLLPYIFFDSAAAVLRDRYKPKVQKETFTENTLQKDALTTYYNGLHIIARRLLQNQTSTITLTGTTDGKEKSNPVDRKNLALARARIIKEFLLKEWGLDSARIKVRSREVPELASSSMYNEGLEENRRVEISSEDVNILSPVVFSRFQEYTPIHSEQIFSASVLNNEKSASWELNMLHRGALAEAKTGSGRVPTDISVIVSPQTMTKLGERISASDSLSASLQVLDSIGKTTFAECNFPIIKSQNQYELSRLSLVVFDFDKSELIPQNKAMINHFAREAIKENSLVSITGSTDRLGEMSYNEQLSRLRAISVNDYVLQVAPKTKITSVKGIGASKLQYDNNLPEGRYYCRTVAIEVKTPKGK